MARESTAMDLAEIGAFLQRVEWVALGSLDGTGVILPDAAPVAIVDGAIYFSVSAKSPSARNIDRDPRVCCAADVFPSYYEIMGATVHGKAERLDESRLPPGVPETLHTNAARHRLPAGDAYYRLSIAADSFGFDFSKIKSLR